MNCKGCLFNSAENVRQRRCKFRFRRRSDTSEMAEHLIDFVSKPICLIKLIDFFNIVNNPIPDPNPKPNPYKNRIKVKKYKKKSLTNFKNKKNLGWDSNPCLIYLKSHAKTTELTTSLLETVETICIYNTTSSKCRARAVWERDNEVLDHLGGVQPSTESK